MCLKDDQSISIFTILSPGYQLLIEAHHSVLYYVFIQGRHVYT